MDLIPAIVEVSNVGAGNADVVADIRSGDGGDEAFACGSSLIFDRRMIANRFNDEMTLGVHYICQIQDRFLLRIESNVQVTVLCPMHGSDAAFNGNASFDDAQPLRAINVLP
jgi:hypothetical protein